MGEILRRKKRDVPSKRPSLPCKNYSYAERSLTSNQTLLLTKGGRRKEGLLNPLESPFANWVPHHDSSPKEEGREQNGI